jgi:anti-anti-sigma factor
MNTNDSRVELVVTPDAQGAYVKASGRIMPRVSSDLTAWQPVLALAAGRTLTLDLCGVLRIDAAGLGLLATLTQATRGAAGDVRLVAAPPRVQRLLEISGLERVLCGDGGADRRARIPCEPLPSRYYQRRQGVAPERRAHTAA